MSARYAYERSLRAVSDVSGVSVEAMRRHDRRQPIADARHVVHALVREISGERLQAVAEIVGRHHSAIIYSQSRVRHAKQNAWIRRVYRSAKRYLEAS